MLVEMLVPVQQWNKNKIYKNWWLYQAGLGRCMCFISDFKKYFMWHLENREKHSVGNKHYLSSY